MFGVMGCSKYIGARDLASQKEINSAMVIGVCTGCVPGYVPGYVRGV